MTGKSRNVVEANKLDNPLQQLLPNFCLYESKGLKFRLETKKAENLSSNTIDYVWSLFEKNMKKLYEQAECGFNRKEKRNEMFDSNAFYLLIFHVNEENETLIGYSHFRFDMDFDDEVVYCYELQIEDTFRKNGLGQYMMKLLELMALKYTLDETDMNDDITLNLDYEILSRKIPKIKSKSVV